MAFVDEALKGNIEVFILLTEVNKLERKAIVVEVYAPKTEMLKL